MTKTIIAPSYQHDSITKELLRDQTILLDVRLIPLESFVDECVPKHNNFDSVLLETLKSLEDQLTILKPYILNDLFIQSIKEFYCAMFLYNIDLDDLSETTKKDQELKTIFSALNGIKPDEIVQHDTLKNMTLDLNSVYLTKQTIHKNLNKENYQLLLDKGAQIYGHEYCEPEKVQIYYAANKRVEVESIAQYIIEHDLYHNDTLIVLLEDGYLSTLEQVFNRYNIDYNLNQNQIRSTQLKFISLVNLIIKQDYDSLIDFLSSNPLSITSINHVVELVNYHHMNLNDFLNYHHQDYHDELMFDGDVKNLNAVSKIFEEAITPVKDILSELNFVNNLQIIQDCFNLMQSLNYPDSDLNTLKNSLIKHKDKLEYSLELVPLLTKILSSSKRKNTSDALTITTIDNIYYYNPKYLIVCGTSASNYPNIKSLNGVIDEKYVRETQYPQKAKRFNQQLKQQRDIFRLASNLTVFYPISTYNGKEIEPSFEIERLKDTYNIQVKRYPVVEVDALNNHSASLKPQLAEKIFLKDTVLYGSVSSLERYSSCPYSYFIQHGLKLRKKEFPELGPAYIGNIFHKILEIIIIDNNLKNNIDHKTLDNLVDQYFHPVLEFQPTRKNLLIKELFKSQLKTVLSYFKDVENDHYYINSEGEKRFEDDFELDGRRFHLKGFIDRIDYKDDYFRIIDYKSSAKTLSEKKFKQGLQLQLITYLLMMNRNLNLKPQGAYYMTLNIQNTSVDNATLKYSKPFYIENSPETYPQLVTANNKISGWHFADPEDFYKSNDYVTSITAKMKAHGGEYNLDTVSAVMEDVYIKLYDDISSGKIDISPVDNPCQYCNYRSICQTKRTDSYKEMLAGDIKLKGAQ